ncbi:TonB-dependent receptor [Proteiniphilum sp.]|uniref:TonB-dependent receptor n=1 Tax=Proteiniphilum sp. TaxID=1926877 RepID=UPI00332FB9ED
MIRYIFFTALLFFLITPIFSQVQMRGALTASENGKSIPLGFANMVLYSASDTTRMIAGTVSDLNGNYLFENLETGRYRLVISSIGYKTLCQSLRVVMPSSSDVLVRDYELEEDSQLLSEVTVEGQLRRQYIDKASYSFTAQDVRSSRYSKDLLTKLPELTVDAQSQNLKTVKGGSLLILINGAAATDNDLRLLPPDKVLRVEYYDFPPARYAGAGAVANVITRSLDDGYGGGADLSHAFTTGFANDNLYFGYNKGRHQLAFDYTLNWRHYRKRESEDLFRYIFDGESRESHYSNHNKFGYQTHTIGLKYTNQSVDNYIFQATVKPNFEKRFEDGKSAIRNTFGDEKTDYTGTNRNRTLIQSPVVDLYYWKSLPRESEISANVVGTLFRTSVENDTYEYLSQSGEQTLSDEMELENRKQSLIGEVAYTKKRGLDSWNVGYKIDANWLDSDINNLLGDFNYRSRYTEQYLYGEFSGMRRKFLYRLSLGAKYITNNSYSNKYTRFVFTPLMMAGYQINYQHTLRLVLTQDTDLPSVSDLSNNAQVITPDIISKGNPMLVNATEIGGGLIYTFNNRFASINTGFLYSYTDKPINEFFVMETDSRYIARTKENAVYGQEYGGMLSGQLKPFGGDIFSIKTSVQVIHQQLNSHLIGNISNWYCPVNVEAAFQNQRWMLAYQYRFTSMNLRGAYLVRDENQSSFTARYRLNRNLSFSGTMLWTFMPSRYHSETLPGSLVNHQRDTKILDNKSMVLVGVNWNFNKGKDYTTKRTIQNQDKDAATF